MRGAILTSIIDGEVTLESLDVYGLKQYKEKPSHCFLCHGKDIEGLEIIGAKTGRLFWECSTCETKFLIYSPEETQRYLDKAMECYSNPYDWENFHLQLRN